MRTRNKHFGELTIDHTQSPGVTPEFLVANGVDPTLAVKSGVAQSWPTKNCNHCGMTVAMRPERTRPRAVCRSCDKYVCDICAPYMSMPDFKCVPLEQKLDEAGNRAVLGLPVGVLTRG